MVFTENSQFYKNGKKMLDNFVASGKSIEDLTVKDPEYRYVKNSTVYDENGKVLTLEEKFAKLKHPRKKKYSSDVKLSLIEAIEEYLESGGSFHINRKKLPFYEKLATYSHYLNNKGIVKTHEEIMKGLGYKNFSDNYYRCKELEKLKQYEDEDGFVDACRANKKLYSYVKDVSIFYNLPYYFTICLLCDKKLKAYAIDVDKVAYTQRLLENHARKYGSFVGIKRSYPKVYNSFEYLTRFYSDGLETKFTKQEWLDIFGLGDIEHRFSDTISPDIDITDAIKNIKKQCPDGVVVAKNVSSKDYIKIVKKAYLMGTSVSELFAFNGLKHKHLNSSRMAKTIVDKIPYIGEMKKRRDEIMLELRTAKNENLCKEELFELKLQAVIKVYKEFKEKLISYLPEDELETNILQNVNN